MGDITGGEQKEPSGVALMSTSLVAPGSVSTTAGTGSSGATGGASRSTRDGNASVEMKVEATVSPDISINVRGADASAAVRLQSEPQSVQEGEADGASFFASNSSNLQTVDSTPSPMRSPSELQIPGSAVLVKPRRLEASRGTPIEFEDLNIAGAPLPSKSRIPRKSDPNSTGMNSSMTLS